MRFINHDSKSTALTALCTLLLSCGDLTDEEKGTPQPKVRGQSESLFSLESGTYYMSDIQALNDGCKKNPLDAQDSITQVPFIKFLARKPRCLQHRRMNGRRINLAIQYIS